MPRASRGTDSQPPGWHHTARPQEVWGGVMKTGGLRHQVQPQNSWRRCIQITFGLMPQNCVSPHEPATELQTSVSKYMHLPHREVPTPRVSGTGTALQLTSQRGNIFLLSTERPTRQETGPQGELFLTTWQKEKNLFGP